MSVLVKFGTLVKLFGAGLVVGFVAGLLVVVH